MEKLFIDFLNIVFGAVIAVSALNPFVAKSTPTPTMLDQIPAGAYSTPSPAITKPASAYSDPDPIVDCKSSHPNCLDQSIKAKQSECKNIYCCSFPDKTVLLHDKTQCVSSPIQNSPQSAQKTFNVPQPPSYPNPVSVSCTTSLGTYTSYGKDSADAYKQCNDLQNYATKLTQNNPTYAPLPTLSQPTINTGSNSQNDTSANRSLRCSQEFAEEKQAMIGRYGGTTGTGAFAISLLEQEYQKCISGIVNDVHIDIKSPTLPPCQRAYTGEVIGRQDLPCQ